MFRHLRLLSASTALLLPLASCQGEGRPGSDADPQVAAPRGVEPATLPGPFPGTEPAAGAPLPRAGPAGAPFHEHRLEAADGAPFDHLGFSVAASGDVIVAGARFADAVGTDSGAVYVFRRGPAGWQQEAKLAPVDAVEHDRFGHAVAIDGDAIIVGAHAHHEIGRKVGSAYVFRRQGGAWRQEARLAAQGAARFGHAVAISGDRAAVGAPGDLVGELPAGAAYVFHRQGTSWRLEARLTASDAEAHDLFGLAVGISGHSVVIGSAGDDERGSLTGAAYVFRREDEGWRQEAKLLAQDATALAEFGKAVAIDGDAVVAGADGASDLGPPGSAGGAGRVGRFAGAAYVFRRQGGGWRQEAQLVATDRRPSDRFGNAVAIHVDAVAVGAHFADPAGLGSGAAYLFLYGEGKWREEAKLVPTGAAAGEEFGNAIAAHGGTVAVGALRGGPAGTAAGSVTVFERMLGAP